MYEYRCRLKRIIDGDSLVLRIDLGLRVCVKKTVRLLGVDTPELRSRDKSERQAAVLARAYVEDWFLGHHDLVVRTKLDRTGKFGRLLADIYGADVEKMPDVDAKKMPCLFLYDHLNTDLLKDGHAVVVAG